MEEKRIANMLYHAYERVYGVTPDLKGDTSTLTLEFQVMTYLLCKYGVTFMKCGFTSNVYKDIDVPMSMEIQDILVAHVFGHDDSEFDEIPKFNNHTNKMLDILNGEFKIITDLRPLARIYFAKDQVLPACTDDEVLAYLDATQDDLDEYYQFIDNVLNSLSDDNYGDNNLVFIDRAIEEDIPSKAFRPILDEGGNGDKPNITLESRKNAAKALLR